MAWKSRLICSFVTQPSLPGTEIFCLRALVADPAEAIPTRVRTTQKTTTMRLWARTQRVSCAILIVPSKAKWFRAERCISKVVPLGYDRVMGIEGREETAATPESTVPFSGVAFTLSSIGYAVAKRFRRILAPLELEPREFALLRAVGALEGQSQQAIGERLLIPPSRMVAFVDALEARSLLERRHNPLDRRTRELHLTDAGRDAARACLLARRRVRARSHLRAQRPRSAISCSSSCSASARSSACPEACRLRTPP